MCNSNSAPAAPDYTPIANAMKDVGNKMYSLGQDQLNFGKQTYQEQMPLYQKMMGMNMEGQRLSMDLAHQSAQEHLKYTALNNDILNQTRRFDQNQAADIYAGRAGADTTAALNQAQSASGRNLTRMGINPNSARFADLNNQFALAGAAAKSSAMTNARLGAQDRSLGMKYQAANIGNGLPATMLNAVGQEGNLSAQNSNLMTARAAPMYAGYAGAMGGLSGQMGGLNSQASTMNMGFQNQMSSYNANQSSSQGMGQLAGMGAMMMMSSKDYKEDKAPIKRGTALEAINNMPIEGWKYKNGIADGGEHVGGYAEDFKRETGLGNGKSIPVVDAIGITMKAVQDLDAKVGALAGRGKVDRKANGGSVRGTKNQSKRGGAIKGPGTGTSDSVAAVNTDTGGPVQVSNGEYIIPADVVRKYGKKQFDKMVKENHTPVRRKSAMGSK